MKVLVLGSDGYIGYPLTIHLLKQGHEVYGVDDQSRRRRVKESLTPILSAKKRINYLKATYKNFIDQTGISLGFNPPTHIQSLLGHFNPDAIVHLAEMPSAPWSMKSTIHASTTQYTNVLGTLHLLWAMHFECPSAHLIKLGTMGEYGTPDCDIPEGVIPKGCSVPCRDNFDPDDPAKTIRSVVKCPMQGLLFPRTAGSFYHLSKVHDTLNIEFCCRNWGLRSTDIMQGIVFGLGEADKGKELTRFDYDECFGTVINRFCVQALCGVPLTVYGEGGQTRGYLPLKDSIQCLTIAINNPSEKGEYRTFNQYESIHSVNELADMVSNNSSYPAFIKNIPNPRKEAESHYYNPTNDSLLNLGYEPTTDMNAEIKDLLRKLSGYKHRINEEVIMPKIKWV